ncbi:FHA domain-containing protein [Kribbella sp. CCNWLY201]|uniref:FHA domain-containing protein n=1 Tax=unclassified Kribbella TaxID=2644121 RepID=UPI003FA563A8
MVTIGRDPSSDLCLHADDRVSRLHVELQRADGRWWIIDRSRNGSESQSAASPSDPADQSGRP